MHYEWYSIPAKTIEAITQTKQRGGRVIAVGTTSLRTLESYALNQALTGDTNLFITPGFQFKSGRRLGNQLSPTQVHFADVS
jgi:S-adenosylmethionine:tRNA ribosyltransferase-isomerase